LGRGSPFHSLGVFMHFSSFPQLEHELVLLRPITAADIEPWFKYLSQPNVYEHTSWDVQEPSELNQYTWVPEEFTASSQIRFAVSLRSNNELIGTAGFHTVSPQNASAEIAYDIAPNYWGRGHWKAQYVRDWSNGLIPRHQ
jgi:ribosomal-protein-alanine N-acetyltransferase